MESWIDLVVAGMLSVLGAVLAWLELRRRSEIAAADASLRSYLQNRMRRRIRVAILLGLLAATIAGAHWIDPDRRPIPYLLAWFFATLLALRLLWLGIIDYLASRMHWVDRTQRNLVDIARTRAELRDMESRRSNGNGAR
jgi:hypothetical protein